MNEQSIVDALNILRNDVHELAKEKGWWNPAKSPLEIHALIHSEVSEAVECVRNDEAIFYLDEKGKPCGELSELADVVIRILDYCGYENMDLGKAILKKIEYNKGRSHRHGGKKY